MLLCRYPNTFPSNTFQSDCILDISNLKNKAISIKDKTERNVRTDRKINDKNLQVNSTFLTYDFHMPVQLLWRQDKKYFIPCTCFDRWELFLKHYLSSPCPAVQSARIFSIFCSIQKLSLELWPCCRCQ